MKVYIENFLDDAAILRITDAFKKRLPKAHSLADSKNEADFVIVISYGHRRKIQKYIDSILAENKKYAVIQLSVRSTSNPGTSDWMPIWHNAELVYSYLDLPEYCKEDGVRADFNFYRAPLGVEPEVFEKTARQRNFLIASTGSGKPWNKECKNEIVLASKNLGKKIFQLGPGENTDRITYSNNASDKDLAEFYSQCEFVSGLRRIEGFELPVIEGLLCGARPICFDTPNFRFWFKSVAEFIPENSSIHENLNKIFIRSAKPVTEAQKRYVKTHFNWDTIIKNFWKKLK